jgi:hypothetical protein
MFDYFLGMLVVGTGIMIYFVTKPDEQKRRPSIEKECEYASLIRGVLDSCGVTKTYESLLDSMNLLETDYSDNDAMFGIIEDAVFYVVVGKPVLERYVPSVDYSESINVYRSFLVGVIQVDVENIRLDDRIPYHQKNEIFKFVEMFYHVTL